MKQDPSQYSFTNSIETQNLSNAEIRLSVNDFNNLINKQLQSLGEFIIEGEITGFNVTTKGGVYITLKDKSSNAIVKISGYKPRIQGINLVNSGMEVAVWGRPEIWSQGGSFSVSIYKILPIGEGALKQAYENLKNKLQLEGLFDENRKRSLPNFLTKIALITAKDSAAYSDFTKILQENNAGVIVDFYPVQVQGKHSIQELKTALATIYQQKKYDCIVVTRGGGSLEDLISFNDEELARVLFQSKIPTIVGVGHENDESIVDYVADLRASTPSQAAYYIADQNTLFIQNLSNKADTISQKILTTKSKYLSNISNKGNFIERYLSNSISEIKLKTQLLLSNANTISSYLLALNEKLTYAKQILSAHNPNNILNKGYAAITNHKGKSITSIKNIKVNDIMNIKLIDGEFKSKVIT